LARSVDNKVEVVPPVPKPDPAAVMPAPGDLLVAPFSEAKPKEVQKSVAKSLQKEVEEKEDLGKGINLEMLLIPAGKFKMGSPASEKGRRDNETQHEVTLTKPFYMGKYEVTQEQWESVMGNNPSSRTKGAKCPVTDVSWNDCKKFIKKLNGITKGKYRLPTEAEWEYACRAGTSTAYSFGAKITPKDANYDDSGIGKPIEVGSYKPNTFGLYDMHGNVWEWCEDWKVNYPKGAVIDPKGPAKGEYRVLRGGSFCNSVSGARSSFRDYGCSPSLRGNGYGFRLARTAL
jgi:formylglycine-generating enzyme required for sulfatase activity